MKSDLAGELSALVYNGSGRTSPHWQVNVASALAQGQLSQFETTKDNEIKALTVELVNRKLTYVTAWIGDVWIVKLINKKESEKNDREQVSESEQDVLSGEA